MRTCMDIKLLIHCGHFDVVACINCFLNTLYCQSLAKRVYQYMAYYLLL